MVSLKRLHQDVYISIALFAFLGYAYSASSAFRGDSVVFPRIIIGFMAALNLCILLQGLKKTDKQYLVWSKIKAPLTAYAFIAAYIALFVVAGYFIATPIFLVAFMTFLKVRNRRLISAVVVLYLLSVYAVFVWQLGVPLL